MRYHFYTATEKAWRAMFEAIEKAQKSIYLESYIFEEDVISRNFIEILKKKSQAGVMVKIIIDSIGSFWFKSKTKAELENNGIEVLFFSPLIVWRNPYQLIRRYWFYRTHRKIIIIDEKIGFLGGVNIGARFSHWLDLHIKLTGVVVRHLVKSFKRSYRFCGGKDARMAQKRYQSDFGRAGHYFLEHWPETKNSALKLKQYYQKNCRRAKKGIIIITPYFVPPRWLIKSLRRAIVRGVKIEIFLPKNTDIKLMNAANYMFAALLQPVGIKFFFIPSMIHAKAFLVDGQEGLIGSNNIDAQSFDFNAEASLVFQRKDMVRDLEKIISGWRFSAEEFSLSHYSRRWYSIFIEGIIKLLQPLL